MTVLGRRALVAGVLGVGTGEALSLGGAFDHQRAPPPGARERFRVSLGEIGTSGVVHIGHSTHVVCVGGRRVLTDPWFSDPAFGALAHAVPPACSPEDLAGIDAIIVSHDHPDHADLAALDRLPDKRRVTVLVGTRELEAEARGLGFTNVRALAIWESHDLGGAVVHAVPAVHDVPEIGFVVASDAASVYFAGDSAWQEGFNEIAARFRPTFAILPVDGTRLRGSRHATLNALEAARAARVLGVRGVMPSHAESKFTDPFAEHVLTASANAGIELFRRELERLLPSVACSVLVPGERVPV
ncbi:MAG TPA: MBL fold metallo-hydrolase [Polyangiaceae bacterium]